MREKLPFEWNNNPDTSNSTIVVVVIIVVIAFAIYGITLLYGTGFNGYEQISIAHTTGAITKTEVFQPGKTLWDWLQLLIIPIVIAAAGYFFNLTVSRNEQRSTLLRDQTEREISSDNQREAALQQYIDKMSELLLDKKLRESQPEDELRKIARVRTLTVLTRLDADRKKSILLFLYESSLIKKDKLIINLSGADLTNINLSGIDLSDADLSGADLTNTILNNANLKDTKLSFAKLIVAELRFAKLIVSDLSGANLSFANLSFVTLSDANLSSTDLSNTNLRGSNLNNANLSNTDLSGADLRNANLNNAKLNNSRLYNTKLKGAELCNVDLSNAKIIQSQLNTAKSLRNAIMPDGSKHP